MRTRVRFETDGTGEREVAMRVHVQSDAGVQRLGELVFGYNSSSERVEILFVRVHKADGSVVTAPADAVQDLTAPIAREAPVYTDYRQKHVTVPGLRPGETLEYAIRTEVHTALAPGHFWLEHNFVKDAIVLDEQLELDVPASREVHLKTQPGSTPETGLATDRRIYRWKSANLGREEEDEAAPRKKKRPRKPEPPAVQLTTFPSWEEVGNWYRALERERIAPSDEIRAKAAALTAGSATDLEKIEALYDFVAKNFRYVSLSFGLGRYQPHAAASVLANQYGDCKDKHTLLAALVEAAGLRAYPALMHSERKIDSDVPAPSQFDHVITAIPQGEAFLWLDTTTEVAPFRLLSANLRKKTALVVPHEGAARLVETPADPPFASVHRVEAEAQVSELGKLTARVHYTLRGDSELALRQAFRQTPQTQWKQLGQMIALFDGLRGDVSDVKPSDPAATHEPFELEYRVAVPNYLDWSSKRTQIALPLPGIGLPDAEDDAEEPVELGTPLEVTTQLRLELPPRYAARTPVPVSVARDYADYRSSYKVEGSVVTAVRKLSFRQREVPAARTRDYLAFRRAVAADETQSLALETSAAGAPTIPAAAKAEELHEAGAAALQAGNFRVAVELLARAVARDPNLKGAWNTLGRAYLALLELDKAVAAFRKQIEVNPYDAFAYNNLGLALWRQQKHEGAAEAFRKQLELNPLDRQALANLGMLYREQKKYDLAVQELEKAIALSPENPLLHVNAGQAYLNLGKQDEAIAAFDKAVELAPVPTVLNNVAYELSLHNAHLDRAQQYVESAIASTAAELRNVALDRLTPNDLGRVSGLAAYWDTLGWVLFQRGRLDQAEKYIRAAWLLDQHGEVGDHLGQIYEEQNRRDEAVKTYAQAIAATRPLPETRQRLAKLLGDEKKVEPLFLQAGPELSALRTVKLGKLLKESVTAEFFVVLAPGPKVEQVKFVSGSEKLRPMAEALRKASYPALFPDATPTKLVRRGILSCSALTGECVFVLMTPDSVTAVN